MQPTPWKATSPRGEEYPSHFWDDADTKNQLIHWEIRRKQRENHFLERGPYDQGVVINGRIEHYWLSGITANDSENQGAGDGSSIPLLTPFPAGAKPKQTLSKIPDGQPKPTWAPIVDGASTNFTEIAIESSPCA